MPKKKVESLGRGMRRVDGKLFIVFDADPEWIGGKKKRRQRMEHIPSGRIRDAESRIRQVKREREEGRRSPKADVPFSEVIEAYEKSLPIHLTARTVEQYGVHCGHITRALGDVPVKDIDVGRLTRFRAALANGQHDDEYKHSLASVKQIMGRLNAILKFARRERNIFANPFEELPSDRVAGRKLRVKRQQEIDCFELDEVEDFLLWLQKNEEDWYCFYRIWIDCGFRVGEQCALKWQHLRPEEGRYYVAEQTLQRPTNTFADPKDESFGDVALSEESLQALAEWRERLKGKNPRGLIFHNNGDAHNHHKIRASFYRLLDRAGLRRRKPHQLRHSCASLMIADGATILQVQNQLRHAGPEITLKVYSHLFPKDLRPVFTPKVIAQRVARVA